MSRIIDKIKNLFYSLPFGLKAADTEIMGSNVSGDGNDTVINQQVNDKRVAKHLLKGEITQEVEELRYRTYKVDRETDKYEYIGNGMAVKKEKKINNGIIKFSQENKLICDDVLTELKRVNSYGVENYTIKIDYNSPVRFKMQEFLTLVDVVIKEREQPVTTLHFSDTRNPQVFKSKPFVTELEKLEELFSKNDAYGLSRNDFVKSVMSMSFTTFKATDSQPDIVSYSFIAPKLIEVIHENGEFKLTYQWKEHLILDLTDKFYNAELEQKYKNKEKKNTTVETVINEAGENWWKDHYEKVIKCSKCGEDINTFSDGYIVDKDTGEPVCIECYKKSLLKDLK
jgi:hypothetical protein